jgi:hypothetical protein
MEGYGEPLDEFNLMRQVGQSFGWWDPKGRLPRPEDTAHKQRRW